MPDAHFDLRGALAPVARLMRFNKAFHTGARMLLIVSAVWVVAFACSKFFWFAPWLLPSLFALGLAAVLFAALASALRGASFSDAARLVDCQLGLKERLATVCELDARHDQSEVAGLLRRDAASHLEKIAPSQLVPLRLPRAIRWTLVALAVTGIIGFLPGFHSQKQIQKQAEHEVVKARGERIELMARRIAENPQLLSHHGAAEDLKKIDEVAKRLSGGSLSKTEALRELTKLTDELKRREQSLSSKDGVKPLDRESGRERESVSPEQMQAMQEQINALQEKLGNTPATEKQIRKLSQALKQARESMKNAKMGAAEGKAMAESLQQSLADADAAQLSQVAEELRKAINALEGADVGQTLQHLDDAIVDLDQAKQQVEALNNLMKQAAKAGKDLAEQLERGQARLAQKTLENLKKQADQAPLTPEQKQQMANELMKALGPSHDYGKLSEHLQQACDHARAGDQAGLSQDLQQAIDQLQQLTDQQCQQMQLANVINELERAGMMIGNQGQCNGQQAGQCLGLAKADGKPGRGVGTWPDQNGAPQYTDRWDNSGISQADTAARGHTDRGEPIPPQGTQIMKVTGKMGSGGPMPGITLHGISIKGESNVKIQEAFSAASQEAENALTKETVPTAYQDAVKEYFDLK